MPSYKELRAQGLQTGAASYPIPQINAKGELVTSYQRIKWTGSLLDAEIETIEHPVGTFPAFVTNTQAEQSPPSEDMEIMVHSNNVFSKPALAVTYPPPPKRDENGNFPSRPDNLPQRPERQTDLFVRERSFGKLISTERLLTADETMARDSQFLVDLHGWKSWASKMPPEWGLLSAAEMEQFSCFQPDPIPHTAPSTENDKIFSILVLFAVFIAYLVFVCRLPLSFYPGLALFMVAILQIVGAGDSAQHIIRDLLLNPGKVLYLVWFWTVGMIEFMFILISAVITLVSELAMNTTTTLRNIVPRVQNASCSVSDYLHIAKHDLAREVRSMYQTWFWIVVGGAVLFTYSINAMLEEPSAIWDYAGMGLCIVMAVGTLMLWVLAIEGPRAVDNNLVNAPPATPAPPTAFASHAPTTISNYSGMSFTDPLTTPPSFRYSKLSKGLRPRALVHDFGTPTRGPLGKGFGARRSPPDLAEPTFFRTPERRIFS